MKLTVFLVAVGAGALTSLAIAGPSGGSYSGSGASYSGGSSSSSSGGYRSSKGGMSSGGGYAASSSYSGKGGGYASSGAKGAPVPPPPAVEVEDADLGFTLSAGYDSTYSFRGTTFGDNLVWVGLDYAVAVAEGTEFNMGAWYANPASGSDNDELDLYAGITQNLGAVDLSVGYVQYFFPEAGGGTGEVYTTLSTEIAGGIGLEATAVYDIDDFEGWYFFTGASYSIGVTDFMSIDLSAGVSYADGYLNVDGFNNVDLRVAFPIALSQRATLEPYIAASIALEGLEAAGQNDHIYGGISLAVSF